MAKPTLEINASKTFKNVIVRSFKVLEGLPWNEAAQLGFNFIDGTNMELKGTR